MLKDLEIRKSLRSVLLDVQVRNNDFLLVEELGLCQGNARIDLALINGCIKGYEIKSDADSLKRLDNQIDIYNRTLDFIIVVVGEKFIEKIKDEIPDWWGISFAEEHNTRVVIEEIRPASKNTQIDLTACIQLLWKDEALLLLQQKGLEKGLKNKPRNILWSALIENISSDELFAHIRDIISKRENWRFGQLQMLNDDLCPL